LPELTFFM